MKILLPLIAEFRSHIIQIIYKLNLVTFILEVKVSFKMN